MSAKTPALSATFIKGEGFFEENVINSPRATFSNAVRVALRHEAGVARSAALLVEGEP